MRAPAGAGTSAVRAPAEPHGTARTRTLEKCARPSDERSRHTGRHLVTSCADSVADAQDDTYLGGVHAWAKSASGVLRLPSGRLVRGRGLRRPLPAGPLPEFAVYLLRKPPPAVTWDFRWLPWRDFSLPSSTEQAHAMFGEAWRRSTDERVELACGGGRGRTGTALACLAVLDGLPALEAVGYVRRNYDSRGVETPWQRRFVTRFEQGSVR